MKNEFQVTSEYGSRVRVQFRSMPNQRITLCKIKYYKENTKEMVYKFQGIAICYSGDTWNDREGRKWAFIDAVKCMLPLKKQIAGRKLLQKAYINFEKELEKTENIIANRTEEDKFQEYLASEDYQEWMAKLGEQDELIAMREMSKEEEE